MIDHTHSLDKIRKHAPLITHADYMVYGDELFQPDNPRAADHRAAKRYIHQAYHRQFVTDQTLAHIAQNFSIETLTEAYDRDQHLGGFPQFTWDRVTWTSATGERYHHHGGPFYSVIPYDDDLTVEAGTHVSRAFLVCVAKQAAQMLIEQHRR